MIEEADRILIFSGEGEHGTWEVFHGVRTVRALKYRLARERCGGDRWASAWVSEQKGKFRVYDQVDLEKGEIVGTREVDNV